MHRFHFLLTGIALLAIGCAPQERYTKVPSAETTTKPDNAEAIQQTDRANRPPVTAEDVAQKSREALDLAGEFAARSRDEFVAEAKQRLAAMDRKIEDWESRSEPLVDDARVRWEQQRDVLRQRRKELQEELTKLDNATADAWQEMKNGASRAWTNLADAFRDAAKHFENDRPPHQTNEPTNPE